MFIGHIAPAALLLTIDKSISPLPVLVGTAFPDLLWSVLILAKREKVVVDANSPLQTKTKFVNFPYSHSLVYTSALAVFPAILFALIYKNWIAGLFFLLASVSHWLLDLLVHIHDLPIFGFGKDRKVGLGLWRHPAVAFILEYLIAAVFLLISLPHSRWLIALITAGALHLFNANAFFGFSPKNIASTPSRLAILSLAGFAVLIAVFVPVMNV
jgi:hypothetical protein